MRHRHRRPVALCRPGQRGRSRRDLVAAAAGGRRNGRAERAFFQAVSRLLYGVGAGNQPLAALRCGFRMRMGLVVRPQCVQTSAAHAKLRPKTKRQERPGTMKFSNAHTPAGRGYASAVLLWLVVAAAAAMDLQVRFLLPRGLRLQADSVGAAGGERAAAVQPSAAGGHCRMARPCAEITAPRRRHRPGDTARRAMARRFRIPPA